MERYVHVMESIDRGEFFFTPTHGIKKDILCTLPGYDWFPITYLLPMHIKPKEGLEDGIIDNVEKLIFIFHKNDKEIKVNL